MGGKPSNLSLGGGGGELHFVQTIKSDCVKQNKGCLIFCINKRKVA